VSPFDFRVLRRPEHCVIIYSRSCSKLVTHYGFHSVFDHRTERRSVNEWLPSGSYVHSGCHPDTKPKNSALAVVANGSRFQESTWMKKTIRSIGVEKTAPGLLALCIYHVYGSHLRWALRRELRNFLSKYKYFLER
jgi:hypothetical protein